MNFRILGSSLPGCPKAVAIRTAIMDRPVISLLFIFITLLRRKRLVSRLQAAAFTVYGINRIAENLTQFEIDLRSYLRAAFLAACLTAAAALTGWPASDSPGISSLK